MLHDLLRSRKLQDAASWVLQEHNGRREEYGDLLRAIEEDIRQSRQLQLAGHLAEFLLLIGDDSGARLACPLALPEGANPRLFETCRRLASPQECFQLEPLTEEGELQFHVEPMAPVWLPQARAFAAQRRIPPFVARLDGGRVFGLSFVPVTEEGKTCLNFVVHNPRNRRMYGFYEDAATFCVINSKVLMAAFEAADDFGDGLLVGNNHNIGHWLLNHLARLALLEMVPKLQGLPVVVGENVTAMHLDCLRLMGIEESRLIRLQGKRLARFRTLWVPMMLFCVVGGSAYWAPNLVEFLRRKLGVGQVAATPRRRRLYLTRRNARWRRVLNESEILELLHPLGFEVVDPGTLSIPKQIEVGSETQIIIGPAGAGMNLLLFAPRDATIIELKHQTNEMDINPMLTFQIGQRYIGVRGIPKATAGSKPLDYDFTVPLDRIQKALSLAGVQR